VKIIVLTGEKNIIKKKILTPSLAAIDMDLWEFRADNGTTEKRVSKT